MCSIFYGRAEGQDFAEAYVWREVYGEDGVPPPVRWIIGSNCDGDQGFKDPSNGNDCVYGDYFPPTVRPEVIFVKVQDDPTLQWETYAHELLHAHLLRQRGDDDRDHVSVWWKWPPKLATVLVDSGLRGGL